MSRSPSAAVTNAVLVQGELELCGTERLSSQTFKDTRRLDLDYRNAESASVATRARPGDPPPAYDSKTRKPPAFDSRQLIAVTALLAVASTGSEGTAGPNQTSASGGYSRKPIANEPESPMSYRPLANRDAMGTPSLFVLNPAKDVATAGMAPTRELPRVFEKHRSATDSRTVSASRSENLRNDGTASVARYSETNGGEATAGSALVSHVTVQDVMSPQRNPSLARKGSDGSSTYGAVSIISHTPNAHAVAGHPRDGTVGEICETSQPLTDGTPDPVPSPGAAVLASTSRPSYSTTGDAPRSTKTTAPSHENGDPGGDSSEKKSDASRSTGQHGNSSAGGDGGGVGDDGGDGDDDRDDDDCDSDGDDGDENSDSGQGGSDHQDEDDDEDSDGPRSGSDEQHHASCRTCFTQRKQGTETLLLCDRCDRAYHMECLIPPLLSVPDGDWHCSNCTAVRRRQHAKQAERVVSLQRVLNDNTVRASHPPRLQLKFFRQPATSRSRPRSGHTDKSKRFGHRSMDKLMQVQERANCVMPWKKRDRRNGQFFDDDTVPPRKRIRVFSVDGGYVRSSDCPGSWHGPAGSVTAKSDAVTTLGPAPAADSDHESENDVQDPDALPLRLQYKRILSDEGIGPGEAVRRTHARKLHDLMRLRRALRKRATKAAPAEDTMHMSDGSADATRAPVSDTGMIVSAPESRANVPAARKPQSTAAVSNQDPKESAAQASDEASRTEDGDENAVAQRKAARARTQAAETADPLFPPGTNRTEKGCDIVLDSEFVEEMRQLVEVGRKTGVEVETLCGLLDKYEATVKDRHSAFVPDRLVKVLNDGTDVDDPVWNRSETRRLRELRAAAQNTAQTASVQNISPVGRMAPPRPAKEETGVELEGASGVRAANSDGIAVRAVADTPGVKGPSAAEGSGAASRRDNADEAKPDDVSFSHAGLTGAGHHDKLAARQTDTALETIKDDVVQNEKPEVAETPPVTTGTPALLTTNRSGTVSTVPSDPTLRKPVIAVPEGPAELPAVAVTIRPAHEAPSAQAGQRPEDRIAPRSKAHLDHVEQGVAIGSHISYSSERYASDVAQSNTAPLPSARSATEGLGRQGHPYSSSEPVRRTTTLPSIADAVAAADVRTDLPFSLPPPPSIMPAPSRSPQPASYSYAQAVPSVATDSSANQRARDHISRGGGLREPHRPITFTNAGTETMYADAGDRSRGMQPAPPPSIAAPRSVLGPALGTSHDAPRNAPHSALGHTYRQNLDDDRPSTLPEPEEFTRTRRLPPVLSAPIPTHTPSVYGSVANEPAPSMNSEARLEWQASELQSCASANANVTPNSRDNAYAVRAATSSGPLRHSAYPSTPASVHAPRAYGVQDHRVTAGYGFGAGTAPGNSAAAGPYSGDAAAQAGSVEYHRADTMYRINDQTQVARYSHHSSGTGAAKPHPTHGTHIPNVVPYRNDDGAYLLGSDGSQVGRKRSQSQMEFAMPFMAPKKPRIGRPPKGSRRLYTNEYEHMQQRTEETGNVATPIQRDSTTFQSASPSAAVYHPRTSPDGAEARQGAPPYLDGPRVSHGTVGTTLPHAPLPSVGGAVHANVNTFAADPRQADVMSSPPQGTPTHFYSPGGAAGVRPQEYMQPVSSTAYGLREGPPALPVHDANRYPMRTVGSESLGRYEAPRYGVHASHTVGASTPQAPSVAAPAPAGPPHAASTDMPPYNALAPYAPPPTFHSQQPVEHTHHPVQRYGGPVSANYPEQSHAHPPHPTQTASSTYSARSPMPDPHLHQAQPPHRGYVQPAHTHGVPALHPVDRLPPPAHHTMHADGNALPSVANLMAHYKGR